MRKRGLGAVEDPDRTYGASLPFSSQKFLVEEDGVSDDDLLPSWNRQEELQMVGVETLDDLYFHVASPPFQACEEEIYSITFQKPESILEPHQERSHVSPFASFAVLKNRTREIGTTNGRKIHGPSSEKTTHMYKKASPTPLWTNCLIELAAGKFIESNSWTGQGLSSIDNPDESSILWFSKENAEGVRLLLDLLSSAEKVGSREYESASRLLEKCRKLSLTKTNAIHRLVYHFTEALCEKIDRETGKFTEHDMLKKWCQDSGSPSSSLIEFYNKSPLIHITAFTGVQIILDHVSGCRKVNVIDFGVRCGAKQMILMEALAERRESHPLEHLKITAVVTIVSKTSVEEAGARLKCFAESLKLNFSFHVIMLEDFADILLDIDVEEATVVHASFILNHFITKQDQLETLMRNIKTINPRVMVISESEADINSPVFVNRFVEALFFFGAHFDWIEDALEDDPTVRTFAESQLFGPGIINSLAAEGEERKYRLVGIDVWRAFFARFEMVETELSESCLHHATLIRKTFERGDSCTLDMDGKCLIVGWKGYPIYSLSAWNFQSVRNF